jgi:hypothetical protein
MYAPVGRWLALWLGKTLSFEEELTCLLWGFGPVLAVGQPGEKLPIAGAARDYAPDDAWIRLIQLRSEQARLIVLMVGSTAGVLTELRLIAMQGFIGKLVLVFPPLKAVTRRARWEECIKGLKESCDPELLAAIDPTAVLIIRFRNARAVTLITSPSRSVHYYKEALRVVLFKELSPDEVLADTTL